MRRVMEIDTPLGEDVLLFHKMTAREELGRLSEFQIDLLSDRGDIKLDDILAKNVTVKLELPENKVRFFNGYVTRFSQVGIHGHYHLYHATVRPWLWFLTRTSDCRIFQNMTVPDIIQQVFDDHPQLVNVKKELTGTYRTYEYCVQYRETDFNFVSRLMEQEGIYYYFKHAEGRHTLILADSYAAHASFDGFAELPFVTHERAARMEQNSITQWNFSREIQPGRYVMDDYDFKKPSVELQAKAKVNRQHDLADYEMYDYPGEYVTTSEGNEYVRIRIEELHSQFEQANGSATARGICNGYLFKLAGHPRSDQNREYLVTSTVHQLEYNEYEAIDSTGSNYNCNFTVLNSREPFRLQRITPKPFVQGPQTAVVVGPSGDEIYTDQYGRVKVQFHWDRRGEKNENSSCWMRVSHPWAGKNWGMVAIPRIGQEVIVDFLEGDPDQPIITGRVYNAEQMPPNELPGSGMMSGMKSNSTPGGGGYNEISADDTKGKEKITIHSQHDMTSTIENDLSMIVVGGNEVRTIQAGTQTITVKGDVSLTVQAGNETRTIESGTQTITVKGNASLIVQSGDRIVDVTGNYKCDTTNEINLQAPSKIKLTCVGSSITMEPDKITLTAGSGASLTLDKNANMGSFSGSHVLLDGNATMSSRGKSELVAPQSTLTGGGSTVVADASGVAVNGKFINLNC
ncbi:type VI secretion system Vgr family protein [Nitrosomonas communis]|uniref:Type VI secretion system secreted protein VgrG n=1 Tax=Nitrosomonas communis TaxID=44574 RepID=A0A1H2V4G5_9PROT|nr:type VI secretion system tip protein VgrG [Nitrosomonas communis]SDW62839.1 type VI secretion system secreted protein VgrG [Nitrosomonas communis]